MFQRESSTQQYPLSTCLCELNGYKYANVWRTTSNYSFSNVCVAGTAMKTRSAVECLNISDMSEWYFKMKNIRSFSSFLQSKDGWCPAFQVSETWRARFSAGSSCWGHSCHRLNNARGSGLHVQNETEGPLLGFTWILQVWYNQVGLTLLQMWNDQKCFRLHPHSWQLWTFTCVKKVAKKQQQIVPCGCLHSLEC